MVQFDCVLCGVVSRISDRVSSGTSCSVRITVSIVASTFIFQCDRNQFVSRVGGFVCIHTPRVVKRVVSGVACCLFLKLLG